MCWQKPGAFLLAGLLTLLVAGAACVDAQTPPLVIGRWEGAIRIQGFSLSIRVQFEQAADTLRGTIDIPQQMARGLLLRNVRCTPPGLHFELPAGPGIAIFDGVVGGDSVSGDFEQAGIRGTFSLARERLHRPLMSGEGVVIHNDSIRLAGTLTLPSGEGRHPACVLIAGSGAQTRDEDVFGFAVFRVLADSLTAGGYAVLRYDKRGVGGSTGNLLMSTVGDLAGDALAAMRYLHGRDDIDTSRIVLIGHSEGGTAAMIAAANSKALAAVVTLGCPAVKGDSLILDQMRRIQELSGITPSERVRAVQLEDRVFASVRADTGWESLRRDLEYEVSRDLRRQAGQPGTEPSSSAADSMARMRVDAQMILLRSPWFRHLLLFDPLPVFRRVQCPVLALYGGKDVQVSEQLNLAPMKQALDEAGNPSSQVVNVPGANHLFQEAMTGSIEEYGALPREFAPGVITTIEDWLHRVLDAR